MALKEAAVELKSGITEQTEFMREACIAFEYSWAVVKELEKESYATDTIEERFSEKRIKKAVKAVEERKEKRKPKGPNKFARVNKFVPHIPIPVPPPPANRYGARQPQITSPNDNDRCYRCGGNGHRSAQCTGVALPSWSGR